MVFVTSSLRHHLSSRPYSGFDVRAVPISSAFLITSVRRKLASRSSGCFPRARSLLREIVLELRSVLIALMIMSIQSANDILRCWPTEHGSCHPPNSYPGSVSAIVGSCGSDGNRLEPRTRERPQFVCSLMRVRGGDVAKTTDAILLRSRTGTTTLTPLRSYGMGHVHLRQRLRQAPCKMTGRTIASLNPSEASLSISNGQLR